MAKKRSVIPDGDAIKNARLKKAWSTEELSQNADCVVKTVENAERRQAIYANTLARIAKALAVDYDSLVLKIPEVNALNESSHSIFVHRVEVTFVILAREHSQIEAMVFIQQLQVAIDFHDHIAVKSEVYQNSIGFAPEGGMVFVLTMTVRDLNKVYRRVLEDKKHHSLFLKIVFLGESAVKYPFPMSEYMWLPKVVLISPPHTNLYGQ